MGILKLFTLAIFVGIVSIVGSIKLTHAAFIDFPTAASFYDDPYQFTFIFAGLHAVDGDDKDRLWQDNSPARIGREWELLVGVYERDGGHLIEDSLDINILSHHIVPPSGPPHEDDVSPNPEQWLVSQTIGGPGAYHAGINEFLFTGMLQHAEDHKDIFKAAFTLFVDDDEHSITSYDVYVHGVHVIPLPAALPLFLSGLFGLGFMARRKKQMPESLPQTVMK